MSLLSISRLDWLRAIAIAGILLLSYAYFFKGNSGDSNQNTRFDLTRAIVERHTLRIDSYHQNTASKALYKGHFYSDKAPGLSLAAVPVWAAIHVLVLAGWTDVSTRDSAEGIVIRIETYLSTLVVVSLPTALAAAGVFLLALKLGASPAGAAFGAFSFGLGTPMWTYAILFRSQATVAALLLFAFAAAIALWEAQSSRRVLLLGVAVGLLGGWATVTEYPAAPAAAILASLALVHARARENNWQRPAVGVIAGALVCATVLMSYQYLVFGSPFRISYAYTTYDVPPPSPEMGNGFFGVTYPRFWIVCEVLFGRYRGLFQLAPVLALAPIGFAQLWRRKEELRASILAASLLVVYYVLLNASYKFWDGGYSTGPRHLAPLVPFLCISLGLFWTWSRSIFRVLLTVLALYGVFVALMAVSTEPMPGTDVKAPIQELFWPAFRTGNLVTSNVGKFLGLHGLYKLLPLLLIWSVGVTGWAWWERRTKREANQALRQLP